MSWKFSFHFPLLLKEFTDKFFVFVFVFFSNLISSPIYFPSQTLPTLELVNVIKLQEVHSDTITCGY